MLTRLSEFKHIAKRGDNAVPSPADATARQSRHPPPLVLTEGLRQLTWRYQMLRLQPLDRSLFADHLGLSGPIDDDVCDVTRKMLLRETHPHISRLAPLTMAQPFDVDSPDSEDD
jgi:hypothetical protein